jgi:hypothetical protein
MEISIKRNALKRFISKSLRENRTHHSAEINQIPAKEDDDMSLGGTPIEPSQQVAIQLSAERPPVEDGSFVPASLEELSLSASVIAKEVPQNQIEYFYRMLHKLLDKTLDNDDKEKLNALQEAISIIIEQDEDYGISEGYYVSMFNEILNNKEIFLPAGVVASVGRIDDTPENRSNMKIKMFNFLSNHVDFRDMNTNDASLLKARKRAVNDAIDHFFYKSDPLTPEEDTELKRVAKEGNIERADLKARQTAVRETVALWNIHKGDLDDVSAALSEMLIKVSGSQEELYFQHALDAIEHISSVYPDEVNKSNFKAAIKAVILSDDLSPTNADEVFESEEDDNKQNADKVAQKRKKSEDQRVWANIASVAGFSGTSGVKQYARPGMLKIMVQTTGVFSDANRQLAMSRSSRAFRGAVKNMVTAGNMDATAGRKLMSAARPDVKDNELFRIFVKEYFWQPYISLFDKTWKSKASDLYVAAGVPEDIAKSDTFVRLAVGETTWNTNLSRKKIESVMSLEDFKRVREKTHDFVKSPKNIQFWDRFSKEFINKISGTVIGDEPGEAAKVKSKANKAADSILAIVLKDKKGEFAYVERERAKQK